MRRVLSKTDQAVVIPGPKKGDLLAREESSLCKMEPWSGCGRRQGDGLEQDWKRDCCAVDYQILAAMVRAGLANWQELEAIGMCSPVRRQTQKRVLATLIARRSAGRI